MSNIQEIIGQDGGAVVFQHFGINTDTTRKQANPFREKSKNFSVKFKEGFYLFQDWVTGEKGNAVKFVETLCQVSYSEACNIVQSLYLGNHFRNYAKPKPLPETKTVYPTASQLTCIDNQTSAFHQFCESLGIPTAHLKKWNVGTYNHKIKGKLTAFVYQSKEKYLNIKSVSYNPITGKRTSDFQSLKPNKNEKYSFCLFGQHLLSGNKIVIVESEKTAVLGSWFYPEYDFLALGSANGLTNDKIGTLFNQKIIFLCDADKAGRANTSIDLIKEFELDCQFVDLFSEKTCGYDLADYLIDTKGKRIELDKTTTFEVQGYLSELLTNEGFLSWIDKDYVKMNFKGSTGAGKTTLAKKIAFRWHEQTQKQTIIAFPLNAIAESKYFESKAENENIPYFVSSHLKGSQMMQTFAEIQESKVMYSNYDALPKLCEIIGEGNYHLIIDEQHCLNKDFGFRAEKVAELFKLANEAKRCILFSADTIEYGFENFTTIQAITPKKERKVTCLKVADMHKILPTMIQRVLSSEKKCLVLLNSKKQLLCAKKVLENRGKRVHTVWSDSALRNDEIYQSLMRDKCFPKNIDVLLCTSVIATGIDLYVDENIDLMYVENRYGFDEVLCNQFFARVRNTENASYTTISIQSDERTAINPQILYNQKIKELDKLALKFNQVERTFLKFYTLQTPFSENLKVFYELNDTIQINRLAVGYWVTTQMIANGNATNVAGSCEERLLMQDDIKFEIKQSKAEIKEVRISNEETVYELFKTQRNEFALSLVSFTQDVVLKEKLLNHFATDEKIIPQSIITSQEIASIGETVFGRFFQAVRLGIDEKDLQHLIFEETKKLRTNVYFYNVLQALKITLSAKLPKECLDVLPLAQFNQFENIRKVLADAFNKYGKLTNTSIQKYVNRFYTLSLSTNQATQLAKTFFDLKEKVTTEDEKKIRYYVLIKENTLESVCEAYSLNIVTIEQNYQYDLKESRREAEKMLQSRNETNVKQDEVLHCSEDNEFVKWFYLNYTLFKPQFTFITLNNAQKQGFYEEFAMVGNVRVCPF